MWKLRPILPRNMATWHVTSHYGARRNALVASTALASRRQERIEVEEFMERHLASAGSGSSGPRSA